MVGGGPVQVVSINYRKVALALFKPFFSIHVFSHLYAYKLYINSFRPDCSFVYLHNMPVT